ncbi:MAG: 4-(cytidine 5'-diphospho)-2-C-methyl-D-erythritol kinase [Bacteroidia bacterium]|jgi:4-diphosphocytidyl-2-C-methyl-D-erythritol kinase|nr:4-(cytidine 5'-diphospho)-2-C-methyl-D-erythritol kinase [Bacteroidia bacterium]MBP7245408.1 4-(cytidine 5'-diphospho)-2-C-methyl-D-erythritol kinase [Bacteroidia bacterium]
MVAFPPVKINLGLNIIAKRADNFHDIESVFYPVGWTDVIEVITTENQEFNLKITGLPIPGDPAKNLIFKGYQLLKNDYEIPGLSFHLHKILPMGAGLGGGSSDGAYALKLINEVAQLGISAEKLHEYALQLGSDCPFFLTEKAAFVKGRGEILEPISIDLSGWYIHIVMPPISISTAEAYSWITPSQPQKSIREIISLPPEQWKEHLKNDFEKHAIQHHPVIGEIKNRMYDLGATYASMSGSGAAVYGLFKQKPPHFQTEGLQIWEGKL